ncbi:hypothetical protein EV715DRAFT_250513 [Schizophyllum commune]
MNDGASISRATSISRTSKAGSTLSRNASLIKKNIAPHDLQPSDVLIERFVAWKAIVKQLIAYFEGVADIENNTAKEMTKLSAVIQVPFRAGNQFLGEGGLQDTYYAIRDKTRTIADHHANLGRTIDSSIVQHLQKLRVEIKAHVKNIQNDTGKLATSVAKERELSTRYIAELGASITAFKNTPMNVTAKTDPYVANSAVQRQLHKQVHEENLLQKSIIIIQQNSAHFEEGIVRAVQSAWQTYSEWQSRASAAIQEVHVALAAQMASLAPDREWIAFSARSDHLLDPDTPLRKPDHIVYPLMDDPSILPVHTGLLERKKRFMRKYREAYYVLTPAGFLHEYASSDPNAPGGQTPTFSLFLPACTLGPPAPPTSRSHKFHIESSTEGGGGVGPAGKVSGLRASLSMKGSAHAWTFRCRSREEMMEWWNDIRMLCARYLVASEQMERSGPVAAAVRSVGYNSEDEEEEEELEDDEEGVNSSLSGEEEGGLEYADADGAGDPPSYAHTRASHEFPGNGNGNYNANGNGVTLRDDGPVRGDDGPVRDDALADGGVARRPSKRQLEKAPEGRAPHAVDEEGSPESKQGPGPVESRFTEDL